MPGRRAQRRLPRTLRGLPAILLSGVFMLVTAGLPAVATAPRADERAADSGADLSGSATSVVVHEVPGVVVKISSPQDDDDLPAPPPSWVDVDMLDLYPVPHEHPASGTAFYEHDRTITDPDRGPPATQRL